MNECLKQVNQQTEVLLHPINSHSTNHSTHRISLSSTHSHSQHPFLSSTPPIPISNKHSNESSPKTSQKSQTANTSARSSSSPSSSPPDPAARRTPRTKTASPPSLSPSLPSSPPISDPPPISPSHPRIPPNSHTKNPSPQKPPIPAGLRYHARSPRDSAPWPRWARSRNAHCTACKSTPARFESTPPSNPARSSAGTKRTPKRPRSTVNPRGNPYKREIRQLVVVLDVLRQPRVVAPADHKAQIVFFENMRAKAIAKLRETENRGFHAFLALVAIHRQEIRAARQFAGKRRAFSERNRGNQTKNWARVWMPARSTQG